MFGVTHRKAKNPKTTEGIPASISRSGLSHFRVIGLAYSERYIAEASPTGTATTIAIPVTINDPTRGVFRSYSLKGGAH